MVRPATFGFNPQTAASNTFQQRDADFTPWLKYTEIRDLPPMGDDRPG